MNFFTGAFGTDPSSNMARNNSSAAGTSSASTIDFQTIAKSVDTATGIAIGLFVAYSAAKHLSEAYLRGNTWGKLPLPPSPPGDFLLGHSRLIPEDESFRKYAKWSKEYSKLDSPIYLLLINRLTFLT